MLLCKSVCPQIGVDAKAVAAFILVSRDSNGESCILSQRVKRSNLDELTPCHDTATAVTNSLSVTACPFMLALEAEFQDSKRRHSLQPFKEGAHACGCARARGRIQAVDQRENGIISYQSSQFVSRDAINQVAERRAAFQQICK
jgi:hypothetical protein